MKDKIGLPTKIFGILLLVAFNGCGGEELKSQWKDVQITVDGASEDWSEYMVHYFDKEDMQIVLGIVNDNTSLSMMLKFRDQRLARMFDRRGVTFWFDGTGKKNKDYGIYYQNTKTNMLGFPRGEMLQGGNGPTSDEGITFQPGGVFSLITQDTIQLNGNTVPGPEAKVDVHKSIYCYELSIPIMENENLLYSLLISRNNKIKLGIELAAVSEEEQTRIKEMMAEREGRGRAGGGMGRGGTRGGGMRGGSGGPGGGRPSGMPDMDGKELWFTVSLANM